MMGVPGEAHGEAHGFPETTGYHCAACGNNRTFKALKPYWHKVEIDAGGMVLESHGIQSDDLEEEVECWECGTDCGPFERPVWKPSHYLCLMCGNEKEFHRFYVEEARERLDENGDWTIVEAWEFDDGAYTTYGAICTPCEAADRDGEVVEIESGKALWAADAHLEQNMEEE